MKKLLQALILTLPLTASSASLRVPSSQDPVLTADNTIAFNEEFTSESVAKAIKAVRDLDFRTDSSDPIYLVINSPGGSIMAGLELIENLSNLHRPVKTISIFSASMGFQTVQGLGERLILKEGTLMSHKPSGSFSGEFPGQLDSRYQFVLKKIQRMDENTVSRTNGKHTFDSYRSLIENEYWCDGKDCVAQGFADRVVKARCDKSLSGTRDVVVAQVMVMGSAVQVTAVFDACPLNTSPLKVEVSVDGKSLFGDSPKKDSWFTWSRQNEKTSKLTAEVLFEIQRRVTEIKSKLENKEVIRGY